MTPRGDQTEQSGALDLTVGEDELLAEEGVFGDQLGFASEKVSRRGDRYRIASGLREMKESLFESRNEGAEQLDE